MKRLVKSKRGLSTVVGAVFGVIVILAGFSLILWEATQYDIYMQAVNNRNRLDQDRASEIIVIENVTIASTQMNFSVTNKGGVTAHLVNLWVTEYNGTTANWHTGPISLGNYLNPGSTIKITKTLTGLKLELNYMIKIVTERGNVAMTLYEPEIKPGTAGDIAAGPFSLPITKTSFQYTSSTYPTTRKTAFEIDNDNKSIVFCIEFQNKATRNIQLSKQSFFLVMVRDLISGVPGAVEYERYFQIVGPTSTSQVGGLQAYNPDYMQTIQSGNNIILKFGADSVGGTTFLGGRTTPLGEPLHPDRGAMYPLETYSNDGYGGDNVENLLWTYLVVFWRYEPTIEDPNPPTFGQTISYVAIRALP